MPYKSIELRRAWARRYAKIFYARHHDRLRAKDRERQKRLRAEHPEVIKAQKDRYYYRNKDRLRHHWKTKREARKEQKAEYDRNRRATLPPDYQKENYARYIAKNRDSYNAAQRKRRETDPQFAIANNMRGRINTALRHRGIGHRELNLCTLIGCSISELLRHLESKFLIGMNWQNRSKWHVDHVKPCAAFDLTQRDQQLICFHFSNLQPLWGIDNIRKGARLLP